MKADLHVHTRFSDGSYTTADAANTARRNGVTHLGVVDHDTTAGLELAVAAGHRAGVEVIPGIEISAYDFRAGRKIHVLGYNLRPPARNVEELCKPLRARRHLRTLEQIDILSAAGYPVTEREVADLAAEGLSEAEREVWPAVLFKQHIMMVLVRKGYTSSIYGSLYHELFKGNGVCSGDIGYVDAHDAVAAVSADGGIPVLAHPGQQRSFDLAQELRSDGLRGVEVAHPDHTREDTRRADQLALRLGLIRTGGSDDHGEFGSPCELGAITAPPSGVRSINDPVA